MRSSGFSADMCFSAMKYNKDGKKNCENIFTNETAMEKLAGCEEAIIRKKCQYSSLNSKVHKQKFKWPGKLLKPHLEK